MPAVSLYKYHLRKIAKNLRDGVYKKCPQNPFSLMPVEIVNDIMSAALDNKLENIFRADVLKPLLTCGKLQELNISYIRDIHSIRVLRAIKKVICLLKSGCQNLEILHLPFIIHSWWTPEVSEASTRLKSEISEDIAELLANSPNLKDLHSGLSFDLKALRNCRELRRLALHFEPQQHWYDFLDKDDHFQTHKCLEFFTVCEYQIAEPDSVDDVAIILRHCPELISMGFVESSGALSRLHGSTSKLNLRHCFWRESDRKEEEKNNSQQSDHSLNLIREAAQIYPSIEELDFDCCSLRSIPCLTYLKNLIYLNITFSSNISGDAFNDALQVIGPQLKHLSFNTAISMDVSLLLQNCRNLESLKIRRDIWKKGSGFTGFVNSSVRLPNLQRLAFGYDTDHTDGQRVLCLFRDCNQLTELFLPDFYCLDDQTLRHFLQKNSLSNLKVALLLQCAVTEDGFRELLLNAPQLEKVRICKHRVRVYDAPSYVHFCKRCNSFRSVVSEVNHSALCNKASVGKRVRYEDEFFMKRWEHGYF